MAKKKSNRKAARARTIAGKAAVKKGAKFEDDVADVYRLLAADVIRNIQICQKKVDILATFRLPGSTTPHRVIVECKDEKRARAQNSRVMEFKGLLDLARKSGEAESAAIITRVPWSDGAKGVAKQSGIELLTYEEKIAQLIDLSTYLKDLVARFERGDSCRPSEPPLGAYYVDLSAERTTKDGAEKIPVIDSYIDQWLRSDNGQRHLAILGEYGTGKTSWCQKVAHDLAVEYLKAPGSSRIPILFSLREFTKTLKIESLVTSFLDEECGVINPRFRLFQAMNQAGIFLLIFDGFDEMAVRVDIDTLEINLQEIEKLAAHPTSKVIITSRLEFFVSGEEEKKSLHPKGQLLATREREYEVVRIVPWDKDQVETFLKKRVPLVKDAKHRWTYYRDRINKIPGLEDLSRRPVLLDMIVKTLPQLIVSGKPINRPNLYETYLLGEIKRQKIVKKRKLLLSDPKRFSLLQRLALGFYTGDISAITFDDAMTYIRQFVKPQRAEREAYTRDFLTCSFLMREGDQYRFSHRSIMEYLAAKGLMEEITAKAPRVFARQRLDPVVAGFLVELDPSAETLWAWLESTRSAKKEAVSYLGGNAASLLCKLDRTALAGRDLSETVLLGADLSSADLRGANLRGAILKEVILFHAQFLKEDLESAIISGVNVSVFCLAMVPKRVVQQAATKLPDPYEEREEFFIDFREVLYRSGVTPGRGVAYFPDDYVCITYEVSVPDPQGLDQLRVALTSPPEVQAAALYADELENMILALPVALRDRVSNAFGANALA